MIELKKIKKKVVGQELGEHVSWEIKHKQKLAA
jgi:hypothetical protein